MYTIDITDNIHVDKTYISCLFLRILGLGDNEATLVVEGIFGADEGVVDNIF